MFNGIVLCPFSFILNVSQHLIKCCREEHKDFYLLWENDDDNLSRAAPEDEELMFEELHK